MDHLLTESEGHSTPRPSSKARSNQPASQNVSPKQLLQPGNGSRGRNGTTKAPLSSVASTSRLAAKSDDQTYAKKLISDIENADPTSTSSRPILNSSNPRLKEDILRLIEQYLSEEGYQATKLVLHDETILKSKQSADTRNQFKNLKKAILQGDWAEVDQIVSKGPLVRTQNAFLYSLYKQHIEYRELQKAFTLLNKRLKPYEHFQPLPGEFKDLCYLLSAKSVHDAPSFRSWEGVTAARENLVESFEQMLKGERDEVNDEMSTFVPEGRLLSLLEQAVCYQVSRARYQPKQVPVIESILQDYTPIVVPNTQAKLFNQDCGNVKTARFIRASGLHLVSGSSDNSVRIWSTASSECVTLLHGHRSRIWEVDATVRGDRVLSASGDKTIKIWDWTAADERERLVTTLQGNAGDVYTARWHPMGNHVASGGYDRIVRLFDVEHGAVLKTFTGHSLSISSVLFNPLGNLIVSGSKDSNVRFWDSVSGLCIKKLDAQLGEVTSLDMSDNYLLTNSRDNSVRLWDIRMLRPLRRFKAHSNTSQNFIRASFVANSSLIVSGSEDGILYLWERENSAVLQTLQGHEGVVYGGVWNDRQGLLASYGSDGIRTWEYDEANHENSDE